jgi:hypothetical protein
MPEHVSFWWFIGTNAITLLSAVASYAWIARGIKESMSRAGKDAADALSIVLGLKGDVGRHSGEINSLQDSSKRLLDAVDRLDNRLDDFPKVMEGAVQRAVTRVAVALGKTGH